MGDKNANFNLGKLYYGDDSSWSNFDVSNELYKKSKAEGLS